MSALHRVADGRSDLSKHLAHLRAEQSVKRERLYPNTATDELGAISRLAAQLWGHGHRPTPGQHGYGGFVEFDRNPLTAGRMGVWKIGYYLSPPNAQMFEPTRRRRYMFQGATYRELFDQVLLWKRRRA